MAEGSDSARKTILVCDDDPDARGLIGSTMSALGYDVIEAADGREAQSVCRAGLPDVIVMDIMMPNLTGLEFVKWFRSEYRDPYVPVLLLTALDQLETRVEGLSLGADDYVTKPFHYRELQARVQALLRVKELTGSLRERTLALEAANAELQRAQSLLLQQEREMVAARMAGAAAHNLGQPLTTLFLNLYVLEKHFATASDAAAEKEALGVIKEQCRTMKEILSKLQVVDPARTTDYVGNTKIVDLDVKK